MNKKYRFSGKKLKALREQQGYTLEQLAQLSDMNSSNLNKIELEKRTFTICAAKQLALALDVYIDEFFE